MNAAQNPTTDRSLRAMPVSRDELLIAALRHTNGVSGLLNRIDWALTKALGDRVDDASFNETFDLLRRRFDEDSGVPLFIAADNLGIDLPPDLRGESDEDDLS